MDTDTTRHNSRFADQARRHAGGPPEGARHDDITLIELGDGGPLPEGSDRPAYERFEDVAATDPDRTAITWNGQRLSYRELDARANRLARRLRDLGVGPERVVAICLPRRPDAIVAVYAVHKAGGAYLPLDPSYPLDRRRFMLEDAGADIVIADASLEPELGAGVAQLVEPPTGPVSKADGAAPDWEPPRLDHLAYIIYTSGSTGRPKGVLIEHGNLAAFVAWGVAAFSPQELSSVLASTSLSFDMSGFELFVPFAAGGQLVLVDNLFALDHVADAAVTLVNTVPSLMAALLTDRSLPETATTVCFCGEPLSAELSERVHAEPAVRRVVNAYGPTEDTIYSTAADVPQGERPTIGRPFRGTLAYVMSEDGRLAARGEAGELYLGGAGVARGYHNREDMTRERFVPGAGHGVPSERLYRTGDLVRWEPDGRLQHLGRIDHQIKVRGVRIEPAEIEGVLATHPGVRRVVAGTRPDRSGEARLVAWFEPTGSVAPDARGLRTLARRALPEPMVPSAFVPVDAMPLNANGKLDRDRLPEPPAARAPAPLRSETERALGELWADVLGLDQPPGADDDFFDLGGQSLVGFRLFELIADRFGRDLPPSTLVEHSTIGALAARIDSNDGDGDGVVVINEDGGDTPFVYLYAGPGGAFALRHLRSLFGPGRPAYGIEVFAELGTEPQGHDVPEVAERTVELLRGRRPHGPYLLSGHSAGGDVAYEMACRLSAEGEEVAFLALFDPAAPHTLRWRGRVTARGSELIGSGPEGRREGLLAAVARRARRSRYDEAGVSEPVAGVGSPDWMRALAERERRYEPPRYSGDAVVFTTSDTARYTGSSSLGWERYVDGRLETVRVPGDHLSMLVDPNVHVLARELAARLERSQVTA
ncbi:MAG: amino acid adenylation domain-containing protein [Thermoleophilaceae bacterium]